MLDVLITMVILYVLYSVIVIAFTPNIKNFIKYEMPNEIASIKKEFHITNKVFDYLTITIFLISLPVTKWEGY